MTPTSGNDEETAGCAELLTLARIGDDARRLLTADLREFHISWRELELLELISVTESPSQQELARLLHIDPSRISNAIDSLETAGLARRETAEDRRIRRIALTPEGRALIVKVRAIGSRVQREVLDGLSAKDRQKLQALLARLPHHQ